MSDTPQPILGRDTKGRFIRGNPGGPGNPFTRKIANLRSALIKEFTDSTMELIAAKLLAKALSGDLAAIRLVLLYAIGRPVPAVDPDSVDRHEWTHELEQAIPLEELHQLLQQLPVSVANCAARFAMPCNAATLADNLHELLKQGQTPAEPEADEPAPPAPSPPAEVIAFPTDSKREKRPRRCANACQSTTPVRLQTGETEEPKADSEQVLFLANE